MNNQDCGCDGSSTNMDILNRNLGANNNINNNPVNNNYRQGNNNTKFVNNISQNQQHINPNTNLNNMIAPIDNTEVNNLNLNQNQNQKPDKPTCKRDLKMFLYVLLALSINEMVKFFINQSIRLNKASSKRYIFYPLVIIVAIVLVCVC